MSVTILFRNNNKMTIKNIKNAVYNHATNSLIVVRDNDVTEEFYGENINKFIVEMEGI